MSHQDITKIQWTVFFDVSTLWKRLVLHQDSTRQLLRIKMDLTVKLTIIGYKKEERKKGKISK